MAAVAVRLLTAADLSEVAELERLCFAEPWSEQSLALLCSEGGFGAVVTVDGRVVAYGGMTAVLDEGSVTNVATHPDFRRQGFGRMAVQTLLDEAAQKGLRRVFLEVRESNVAAQHLYQVMGFSPCGVRKNFYRRPTEHAVLYVAAISV
ncbi:MAG: ribosomal-protein-alanine N-acetyltransferase [Ruminococcaceae bacterium]|nr:ribosomal-protein-alanine N-acetyltransferase [Oscillospiraceae bacterium]